MNILSIKIQLSWFLFCIVLVSYSQLQSQEINTIPHKNVYEILNSTGPIVIGNVQTVLETDSYTQIDFCIDNVIYGKIINLDNNCLRFYFSYNTKQAQSILPKPIILKSNTTYLLFLNKASSYISPLMVDYLYKINKNKDEYLLYTWDDKPVHSLDRDGLVNLCKDSQINSCKAMNLKKFMTQFNKLTSKKSIFIKENELNVKKWRFKYEK